MGSSDDGYFSSIWSALANIPKCLELAFTSSKQKQTELYFFENYIGKMKAFVNNLNVHDFISVTLYMTIFIFVALLLKQLIITLKTLIQKKISSSYSKEFKDEQERFERNISSAYYGIYKLAQIILHPCLFQYLAATYFKNHLRHPKKSEKENSFKKKGWNVITDETILAHYENVLKKKPAFLIVEKRSSGLFFVTEKNPNTPDDPKLRREKISKSNLKSNCTQKKKSDSDENNDDTKATQIDEQREVAKTPAFLFSTPKQDLNSNILKLNSSEESD